MPNLNAIVAYQATINPINTTSPVYTWSLPLGGGTITTNNGDDIIVTWGAVAGNYKVRVEITSGDVECPFSMVFDEEIVPLCTEYHFLEGGFVNWYDCNNEIQSYSYDSQASPGYCNFNAVAFENGVLGVDYATGHITCPAVTTTTTTTNNLCTLGELTDIQTDSVAYIAGTGGSVAYNNIPVNTNCLLKFKIASSAYIPAGGSIDYDILDVPITYGFPVMGCTTLNIDITNGLIAFSSNPVFTNLTDGNFGGLSTSNVQVEALHFKIPNPATTATITITVDDGNGNIVTETIIVSTP